MISAGSGVEGTVTLQQLSPQFQGLLWYAREAESRRSSFVWWRRFPR